MGFLDRFGLGKKKPRPVGQRLEKGRDAGSKARRKQTAAKVGIILGLVLLTLAAFPRGDLYQYTVQVGSEWRQENVVAPFDYPIIKTEATLTAEREEVRFRTPPFFAELPNAQERMAANRDSLANQLEAVFERYAAGEFNRLRGRTPQARRDSARYQELRRSVWLKGTPEQWQRLVQSYVDRTPGLSSTSRTPVEGPRLDEELLQQAWALAAQLNNIGVLDVPLDSVLTDQIVIRDEAERLERVVDKDNLYGLNEAFDFAQQRFAERYADDPQLAALGSAFFRVIFAPSLQYMRAETMQEWERKARRISPVTGKVSEGDLIVRQGQVVTDDIKRRLTSLEQARLGEEGAGIIWRTALGQLLVTIAVYIIFFVYLFLLRRQIFDDNSKVLLMALLFGGIIGLFAIAIRLPSVAMYAVPVVIAPVLLTVMFDSRVGLFGALTLSLVGGLLLNYSFEFTFATIFATSVGVFSVRDIKNRGQFFLSAGIVFVGYLMVLGATAVLHGMPRERFLSDLLLVGVNSFLLVLAYPLLWVFERAFDICTDLSLLELSDTNRKLLKDLGTRAPGTFNHSLQVANLAEAAADAVGANALLTRVGALYHDIGKMLKPEYFVENQRPDDNPHDQLKPRMSALIIASHVKEGLEMGRQHNLPQRVLNFIPMHHGTTRIEYFYRKALELRQEDAPELLESEFRYPGPRPDSKETGILMLADSVEAASRSLSDPTHKRLETLIDMIFKARIEDGQLDRSDLTFRDLAQIKETFLGMLLGIYHVRVKYPGQDDGRSSGGRPTSQRPQQPVEQTPRMPKRTADQIKKEGVLGTLEQGIAPGRLSDEDIAREMVKAYSGEDDEPDTPFRDQAEAPPAPPNGKARNAKEAAPSEADDASKEAAKASGDSADDPGALDGPEAERGDPSKREDGGVIGDPRLRARKDDAHNGHGAQPPEPEEETAPDDEKPAS